MSNSHYRSHSKPLFYRYNTLNTLNVYDTYIFEIGIFMYKYFNDLLPKMFNNFCMKRSDFHDYPTRNRNDYQQTRNKQKSVYWWSCKNNWSKPILWNSLNPDLKNAYSINLFRKKKTILISSYN